MILRAVLILSLVLLCESTDTEAHSEDLEAPWYLNVRNPPSSVTKDSIIAHHKKIDNDRIRKFGGATLVYAENEKDYNLIKQTVNKLTHVSPTWLWLKVEAPEDKSQPWGCSLDGQDYVDNDWISSLLETNEKLKIFPQISLETWKNEHLEKFLEDEVFNKRCLSDVVQYLSRRNFDGAVLDVFPYVKDKLPKMDMTYLYEMVDVWSRDFHQSGLKLILRLGQAYEEIKDADGTTATRIKITSENIQNLANVDYLQIDIHRPIQKNAYLFDFVKKIVTNLSKSFDETTNCKLILGIDYYIMLLWKEGDEDGMSTVDDKDGLIDSYFNILKHKNAVLEWHEDVREHMIINKKRHYKLAYPTLTSIEVRLDLAESLNASIAISEYGRGLNYFSWVL